MLEDSVEDGEEEYASIAASIEDEEEDEEEEEEEDDDDDGNASDADAYWSAERTDDADDDAELRPPVMTASEQRARDAAIESMRKNAANGVAANALDAKEVGFCLVLTNRHTRESTFVSLVLGLHSVVALLGTSHPQRAQTFGAFSVARGVVHVSSRARARVI